MPMQEDSQVVTSQDSDVVTTQEGHSQSPSHHEGQTQMPRQEIDPRPVHGYDDPSHDAPKPRANKPYKALHVGPCHGVIWRNTYFTNDGEERVTYKIKTEKRVRDSDGNYVADPYLTPEEVCLMSIIYQELQATLIEVYAQRFSA